MNEFDKALEKWMRTTRFISDPEDLAAIYRHAEILLQREGGYISPAHFERAYLELLAAKEISEARGPAPVYKEAAPINFTQMSIAEIRKRYAADASFRAQYDASNGRGDGSNIPRTAAEYNSIPTSETIRRYGNEPQFRAAVDRLIAEGKI